VTLPLLDKYKHFHPANFLSTFSKIGFHIVLSLNLHSKEYPNISLEEYLTAEDFQQYLNIMNHSHKYQF